MQALTSPFPSSCTPASAAANERLADRHTPLVGNRWYVAGYGSDFGTGLVERTLLGRSLLLYRTEDGRPVALQNRCPHRSYPLSHGQREGDRVRCGYHGIAFDARGQCADIPSQATRPASVQVPSYALAERGPLVWIWAGDAASADERLLPDTGWLTDPQWRHATSYLSLQASYITLHENLLDLTHFTYLHPSTLGTPEVARTEAKVDVTPDNVRISRFVERSVVPPIYQCTGMTSAMSRHTISDFHSPALHHASAVMVDLEPGERARREFTVYITHYLTPETQDRTHYWFTFARDFALDDDRVTEQMAANAIRAFNEDKFALEEIDRIHRQENDAVAGEVHVKSDAAGVAMRRMIRRLAG